MAQEIFQRIEKKYLLQKDQYHNLIRQMGANMYPDEYGTHTIRNIYFDTDNFHLIRTSIEKPVYKEKIRLRSYGKPEEDDAVFVELKKKYNGVVYKRRVEMEFKEARDYLYNGYQPKEVSQILREIDYSIARYQVSPAVYIAYDRTAYCSKDGSELRVTFDTAIRGRTGQLHLEREGNDRMLLEPDQFLMEVKIPGAMPIWMSRLFAELGIYPISFSKYGLFYQQYITPQYIQTEGGKACA